MTQQTYYVLYTHSGYFELAQDGGILYDSARNYHSNGQGWKIIGIGTRHMSQRLISLDEAANGADIGQGWVHDIDHGTHRMWGMPTTSRAVRVKLAEAHNG